MLFSLVLDRGNFGRRNPSHVAHMVGALNAQRGGIVKRYAYLTYSGAKHWRLAARKPILKPFSGLFKICHYVNYLSKIDHPVSETVKAVKISHQQKKLFKRLGIYEHNIIS